MNIFILDNDTKKSAQYHCDKHVVKMIVEYAQILSTACRLSGEDAGYRITHKNHPCTKWACESITNWIYLRQLLQDLHKEWQFRFNHPENKLHKSFEVAMNLPVPKLPMQPITPFAQAMPEKYRNENAVKAYRDYYNGDKQHLAAWKKREKPPWFLFDTNK